MVFNLFRAISTFDIKLLRSQALYFIEKNRDLLLLSLLLFIVTRVLPLDYDKN